MAGSSSSAVTDMVVCVGQRKHPAHWDDLLSERSKLFYDGTYKWDGTEGFWDDTGIHHDFNDPNDPEAYPPTPRPVGLWLEDTGDVRVVENGQSGFPAREKDEKGLLRDCAEVKNGSVQLDFVPKLGQEDSKVVLIDGKQAEAAAR